MGFSLLDWIFIIFIGLSTLFGLISGFIRSVLSVLIWVGAVIASMVMGPALAQSFSSITSNPTVQLWASYGVVFICAILLGWVMKMIVTLVLVGGRRTFGGFDALLGAGFGFVRGNLLAIVFMWFGLLCGINQTSFYQQSKLAPFYVGMTTLVAQLFPNASQEIQSTVESAKTATHEVTGSVSGLTGGLSLPGSGSFGGSSSGGGGILTQIQSGISQLMSTIKTNLASI